MDMLCGSALDLVLDRMISSMSLKLLILVSLVLLAKNAHAAEVDAPSLAPPISIAPQGATPTPAVNQLSNALPPSMQGQQSSLHELLSLFLRFLKILLSNSCAASFTV